jgi:chaperonin cofactor prefoldin
MGVSALDLASCGLQAGRDMRQITSEQLGSALRRLAADVVAERRRVTVLERENRELRERIQELERALSARKGRYAGPRKAA